MSRIRKDELPFIPWMAFYESQEDMSADAMGNGSITRTPAGTLRSNTVYSIFQWWKSGFKCHQWSIHLLTGFHAFHDGDLGNPIPYLISP